MWYTQLGRMELNLSLQIIKLKDVDETHFYFTTFCVLEVVKIEVLNTLEIYCGDLRGNCNGSGYSYWNTGNRKKFFLQG